MRVSEGMTATVLSVGPHHTLRDAARLMAEKHVGAAVVTDPEQPGPGIITERDILVLARQGRGPGRGAGRRPPLGHPHARLARLVARARRRGDGRARLPPPRRGERRRHGRRPLDARHRPLLDRRRGDVGHAARACEPALAASPLGRQTAAIREGWERCAARRAGARAPSVSVDVPSRTTHRATSPTSRCRPAASPTVAQFSERRAATSERQVRDADDDPALDDPEEDHRDRRTPRRIGWKLGPGRWTVSEGGASCPSPSWISSAAISRRTRRRRPRRTRERDRAGDEAGAQVADCEPSVHWSDLVAECAACPPTTARWCSASTWAARRWRSPRSRAASITTRTEHPDRARQLRGAARRHRGRGRARSSAETGEPHAIGAGIPSQIDFASGTVLSSVNIPLEGVPLRDELSSAASASRPWSTTTPTAPPSREADAAARLEHRDAHARHRRGRRRGDRRPDLPRLLGPRRRARPRGDRRERPAVPRLVPEPRLPRGVLLRHGARARRPPGRRGPPGHPPRPRLRRARRGEGQARGRGRARPATRTRSTSSSGSGASSAWASRAS